MSSSGSAPGGDAMTDRNGKAVTPGDRVRFRAELREGEWLIGTVRSVKEHTYYRPNVTVWEAKVDDGYPSDPDLSTNAFSYAAHVESDRIEVLEAQ